MIGSRCGWARRRRGTRLALISAVGIAAALGIFNASAQDEVDTALIVSIDVSNSVDAHRYKLQMEGIAKALEDPEVVQVITAGAKGGILFSMITWADKPRTAIPWKRITSAAEAAEVARNVRSLPQQGGEFTCLSNMLRTVADKVVTQIPAETARIVVDVSGDGKENCNPEEVAQGARQELLDSGVTINGLPILEGDDGPSLEGWYRENVVGGPGHFVLSAAGFEDFGRAIRQKFIVEISGRELAAPPPG